MSQSTWVSQNTEVGFGGRSRQRSGQLRDWRPESNCPSDQIQLESRWLFPHPSAVGNYGQFSAARVRGRLGGRQHLSECTQKSDECYAAAPGIKSVVSELDIFVSSAGIALDRMNRLKNKAFVGHWTLRQRDQLGWLRGLGEQENRQHRASEDLFRVPRSHGAIVLGSRFAEKLDEKVAKVRSPAPGTALAFKNGVAALSVDGKMAKMHIYRPVQL